MNDKSDRTQAPTHGVQAPEATSASGDTGKPLYVLKFGGSVLETLDDFSTVAGEIYRQWRKGRRLLVVVSAMAGTTDFLFAEAHAVAGGTPCTGYADVVSSGEEHAAALLRLACNRIGIEAALCRAEALGLIAGGEEQDGNPAVLHQASLSALFNRHDIVIAPGFVALGHDGCRKLLGRGGTDTSAVFLAGELGAACVRLYKDVDGVFEADPAQYPAARKYREVSWGKALAVAGPLVHAKAVYYAQSKRLPIEVEGIGGKRPSRIAERDRFIDNSEPHRPVRIALAGYGTVGQQLTQLLVRDPHYEITAILVRDSDKPRDVTPPITPITDIERFESINADILVDALSCDRLSAQLGVMALLQARPMVTASKRVMAQDMAGFEAAAREGDVQFRYSAAVGGSMPVLEAIDQCAVGSIRSVSGVLNGTVNFVLEQLRKGRSLNEAMVIANTAGLAEADSDQDLSGADAAAKLAIIAHRAFGIDPQSVRIDTEALDAKLAAKAVQRGVRHYQLASLEKEGDRISGTVRILPESEVDDALHVGGEWNAARIELASGSEVVVRGRGAGGYPTAQAMLADLEDLRASAIGQ